MIDISKVFDPEIQSIGAILNNPSYMPIAYPYLDKIHFKYTITRTIAKSLIYLYENNIPIDLVSIVEYLHKEVGITSDQVANIYQLELSTVDTKEENLIYWLNIVLEESRNVIVKKTYLEGLKKGLSEIESMEQAKAQTENMKIDKESTLKSSVDSLLRGEVVERALLTGLKTFDNALEGGLKTKQLVVLGGRTGIGKSLMSMTIATNVALKGYRVLVCCTEMSDYILARRYISSNFNIPLSDVKPEKMNGKILDLPDELNNILIDKSPGGTIERVIGSIRSIHNKKPLSLVLVDHIQRLDNDRKYESQVDFLKRICSSLKNIAMSLDICVLAVSQFTREASKHKPALYNYRGSGGIEEEADVGILLDSLRADGPDIPIIVKIAKGRDISKSTFGYILEQEYGRFREPSTEEEIMIKRYENPDDVPF